MTTRMISSHFCMSSSRMKSGGGSCCTRKSHVSLLDRFRDAVFRLIMLSALSKAANNKQECGRSSSSWSVYEQSPLAAAYYYPYEPHHSEAVADCIEFIKKSATAAHHQERGGGGGGGDDAATAAEVVSPARLMLCSGLSG